MAVTAAVLSEALKAVGAGSRLVRPVSELAAGADGALRQAPAGLTANGCASFLATMAQESDFFRATEEYAKNGRYKPYIGRTFEMITWKDNYAAFGRWCKAHGLLADANAFVNDPPSLASYQWAWLGGVQFFEQNGIWPHANAGNHWRVSQLVNGGQGMVDRNGTPNHWSVREKMFKVFQRQGAALLPSGAVPAPVPHPAPAGGRPELHEGDTSELVWKLQVFMNRVFPAYSRINAGDKPPSRLGPQTVGVLTEFQRRSGIPTAPPFAVGPKTWAALEKSGFRG